MNSPIDSIGEREGSGKPAPTDRQSSTTKVEPSVTEDDPSTTPAELLATECDPRSRERRKTREQALKDALREALVGVAPSRETVRTDGALEPSAARDRERRRWQAKAKREDDAEFIHGIEATAELIRQTRDASGEPVYRTDAQYRLLAAIERGGGWPSISEVARTLRVSKQAARQQVIAATRAKLLELVPDPFDRRSIQIGLTISGKNELAAGRSREIALTERLLLGLGVRERRLVAHVLRVMRARLLRAEREMQRRQVESRRASRPLPVR